MYLSAENVAERGAVFLQEITIDFHAVFPHDAVHGLASFCPAEEELAVLLHELAPDLKISVRDSFPNFKQVSDTQFAS